MLQMYTLGPNPRKGNSEKEPDSPVDNTGSLTAKFEEYLRPVQDRSSHIEAFADESNLRLDTVDSLAKKVSVLNRRSTTRDKELDQWRHESRELKE